MATMADISNNTTLTPTGDPNLEEAYDISRNIKFYSLIVVIIIGIIFNTLAIVVLSKSHIKKTSTGVYLIFLSVSDTVVLLGEFLRWLHEVNGEGYILGIDFMDNVEFFCKFIFYMRYFGRIWSCWMVVIITVERYLSIAHPLRASSNSMPKKALIICFIELILAALLCTTVIFSLEIQTTGTLNIPRCIYNKIYKALVLYPIIGAFELILPSVIVFFFTILILNKLYKANELRRVISISQPNSRSSQLTSTLLGLALTFVFIRLPYMIIYVIDIFTPYQKGDWNIFYLRAAKDASYVLSVVNYAINFFLYCLCGSIFRSELRRVLCSCGARPRPSTTYLEPYSSPSSRHGRLSLSRIQYNGVGTGAANL